jgi:asparagine synthetase B (glutamine-hydrolysing)
MSDDIDREALEKVLQNGCEFLEPVFKTATYNDIKIDYIEPIVKLDMEKLTDLMTEAVRKSMAPHEGKKIAVLLSGGTDSTTLLTLLMDLFPDMNVTAYHTYFKDPTRDERDYAMMAAKNNVVPLRIIDMGKIKQIEMIPECIKECRVVMAALPYSYGMAKEIAADGMEVVINSLSLDEYFGAYSIDKKYYERRKWYPFVHNRNKYTRELARRFGTDKAFFVNNIAISSGNNHVIAPDFIDNKYDMSYYFDMIWEGNLWSTMKRHLFERVLGGHYRLFKQPVDLFNMEFESPFVDRDLAEYCFSCNPWNMYNKTPLRELMRNLEIPEPIVTRGENWAIDNDNKVGWCPSPGYYVRFTQKFFPDKRWDLSPYLTKYAWNHLTEWIINGDRRAQQLGLFASMLGEI